MNEFIVIKGARDTGVLTLNTMKKILDLDKNKYQY
jgi:hypothetical protein